ncbi:MAG: hypothetical protein K0V04_06755 [Deltaproteobacteria bacterium]|nr:hypothetical protein [Deltaproteobacteria bacterium]
MVVPGSTVTATPPGPSAVDPSPRVRVLVTIAGPVASRDGIGTRLQARLSALPVELEVVESERLDIGEVVWPKAPAAARARVWVDLGDSRGATLYVTDEASGRVMLRAVPGSDMRDEVTREALAQIVFASVEAILAGATVGLTREDVSEQLGIATPPQDTLSETPVAQTPRPPADRSPPSENEASPSQSPAVVVDTALPPPRPTRAAWSVSITAGYHMQAWASGRLRHGPQASVTAAWLGAVSVGGWVSSRVVLPSRVALGDLSSRVGGATMVAGLSVGDFVAPRVSISGQLGGGFSLLRVVTSASTPGAQPRPARTRALPTLASQLTTSVWSAVGRYHVVVSPAIGLELDPVPVRLLADDGALRFAAWAVRPYLGVGVGFGARKL